MIPGLSTAPQVFQHFNFPEESATVDTNNWTFNYSTNDLKIVQFNNVPQFTEDDDLKIRKFAAETNPKTTKDWERVATALSKSASACRFRYYGPLQGK